MKKLIFILIIALALVVFLHGKHTEEPIIDTSNSQEDTLTSEVVPNEKDDVSYSFEYTDIHFAHSPTETVNVSIDYPQFKDEKLSELNKKIETIAKSKFKDIIENPEVSQEISLKETLSVELSNSNIVSILCTGERSNSSAENIITISNAYNIHPISLNEYETVDILNTSDEFINLFKEEILKNEELTDYLNTIEDYKTLILASSLYITDKNLVIIVSVPQEIGDFVEVTFKIEEIKDFLLLSL